MGYTIYEGDNAGLIKAQLECTHNNLPLLVASVHCLDDRSDVKRKAND